MLGQLSLFQLAFCCLCLRIKSGGKTWNVWDAELVMQEQFSWISFCSLTLFLRMADFSVSLEKLWSVLWFKVWKLVEKRLIACWWHKTILHMVKSKCICYIGNTKQLFCPVRIVSLTAPHYSNTNTGMETELARSLCSQKPRGPRWVCSPLCGLTGGSGASPVVVTEQQMLPEVKKGGFYPSPLHLHTFVY